MNELISFKRMVAKVPNTYGLCAFMVTPDGTVMDYARLIDRKILEEGSPSVLQFFGDDMMLAFQIAALETLPNTKSETSENSGLQQEPNINTDIPKSPDSSPDTSEDLWESEGGGQASNYNEVQD